MLAATNDRTLSAQTMTACLIAGNVAGVVNTLQQGWLSKKQTDHGISAGLVDHLLNIAPANGAFGSKVSGVGGFPILLTDAERSLGLIGQSKEVDGKLGALKLAFVGSEAWAVPGSTYL